MSYRALKGALDGITEAKGRIYLLVAPQAAPLPFIVMQRISQAPLEQSFDGPTDLEPGRYQVSFWTSDARDLPGAERAIRTALKTLGDAAFVDGLSDDEEAPASGEGRAYVIRFEVEIVSAATEA